MRRPNLLVAAVAGALTLGMVCAAAAHAASGATDDDNTEPRSGEYRVTVFPFHKITDTLTGFGYLGYVTNPDKHYRTGYLGWGATYTVNPHVQLWGGLIGTYTNNEESSDKLELRPFAGVKLFVPNGIKWNIYNFMRFEYRDIQDRETGDWSGYSRIRDRIGVEFPLASAERAWQAKTWYGLADAELFYRFDRSQIDPARLRAGIAYIASNRVRVELIYHMQWTRPTADSSLKFTDNIIRLNIKVGLTKGRLLSRLVSPDIDD